MKKNTLLLFLFAVFFVVILRCVHISEKVIDNRPSVMPGEMQVLLRGHRRLHIKELVSLGPPFEVEVEHWSK